MKALHRETVVKAGADRAQQQGDDQQNNTAQTTADSQPAP